MSAELALQGAIVSTLYADAALLALTGPRKPSAATLEAKVYDRVQPDTAYPYVSIGEIQALDDGTPCIDGLEVFATLHVWSNKPGKVEAARIVHAVRAALHDKPLSLDEPYRLVLIEHQDTRIFDDPTPLITHGVMTFRALIERA